MDGEEGRAQTQALKCEKGTSEKSGYLEEDKHAEVWRVDKLSQPPFGSRKMGCRRLVRVSTLGQSWAMGKAWIEKSMLLVLIWSIQGRRASSLAARGAAKKAQTAPEIVKVVCAIGAARSGLLVRFVSAAIS